MTETLSPTNLKQLKLNAELAKGQVEDEELIFNLGEMIFALNTIEARDKEIEALKGQVAALSLNAPRPDDYKQHAGCYIQEHWDEDSFNKTKWTHYDGNSLSAYRDNCDCGAFQRLKNTKAKAEAFIASIRADEREKTIREVLSIIRPKWERGFTGCNPDNVAQGLKEAIEALLTKEQA